jgi:hypothetical protein
MTARENESKSDESRAFSSPTDSDFETQGRKPENRRLDDIYRELRVFRV